MTATTPADDTETQRVEAIRARLTEAVEEWLWHEATDDVIAGYGAHMGQMLYRLPADGQTRDMKASIESLIADATTLLDLRAARAAGDDLDTLTLSNESMEAVGTSIQNAAGGVDFPLPEYVALAIAENLIASTWLRQRLAGDDLAVERAATSEKDWQVRADKYRTRIRAEVEADVRERIAQAIEAQRIAGNGHANQTLKFAADIARTIPTEEAK